MKAPVYSLAGKAGKEIALPKAFSEQVRKDLIKRAVLAEQSRKRQAYGADPIAGMRTSAHYHGRRGARNTMMNRELARLGRIHGSGFLHFRARGVAGVVKGPKAHAPKAEKVWKEKINKKEWMKALQSAIAAGANKDLVTRRGHKTQDIKNLPLILDDKLQDVKKAKDLVESLKALGLEKELARASKKKTRAGRGKSRGRRNIKRKGPLIIVSEDKGVAKAGRNIPGVDIVSVKTMNVEDLAPGAVPGRLCVWSLSAVEALGK